MYENIIGKLICSFSSNIAEVCLLIHASGSDDGFISGEVSDGAADTGKTTTDWSGILIPAAVLLAVTILHKFVL